MLEFLFCRCTGAGSIDWHALHYHPNIHLFNCWVNHYREVECPLLRSQVHLMSQNKKSHLSPTAIAMCSLHLSECLSPSLIPALYIELGDSPMQNTPCICIDKPATNQFSHLLISTRFGGVKLTNGLITDAFFANTLSHYLILLYKLEVK